MQNDRSEFYEYRLFAVVKKNTILCEPIQFWCLCCYMNPTPFILAKDTCWKYNSLKWQNNIVYPMDRLIIGTSELLHEEKYLVTQNPAWRIDGFEKLVFTASWIPFKDLARSWPLVALRDYHRGPSIKQTLLIDNSKPSSHVVSILCQVLSVQRYIHLA